MYGGVYHGTHTVQGHLSKNVLFDISSSGGNSGEKEVSTVPTQCPEQYSTIFVFRAKNVFYNISISGGLTGEREVSTVPTWCLKCMRPTISV